MTAELAPGPPGGDLAGATVTLGAAAHAASYTYDEVGNLIAEATGAGETSYAYDSASRLQSSGVQ